jgi:hypothetical protein
MNKNWDILDEEAMREGTARKLLNSYRLKRPKTRHNRKAVYNSKKKKFVQA